MTASDPIRLSVVLPNYNHGKVVGRAIEAIAAQSRLPDELIILDDGSTDESLDVITGYMEQYPFARLLRHERNRGVVATVNRLFDEATGTHIYGASADDLVLPGFFEGAVDLARRYPAAGVIFGCVRVVDEAGRMVHHFEVPDWTEPGFVSPNQFALEYLARVPAGHTLTPATIYRREPYKLLGGHPIALGPWGDTFLCQVLALQHGACYLPWDCASFTTSESTFSGVLARDLESVENLVRNGARMMEEEPYARLFPAGHAARWSRQFRRDRADEALWRVQKDMLARRARVGETLERWGALAQPIRWLADRLLGLRARWMHRRVVRRIVALGWPLS